MASDIAADYPPTPPNVPPDLTRPTGRYRLQVALVAASLLLFLAVYLSIIAGCAALTYWAVLSAIDFQAAAATPAGRAGLLVVYVLVALGFGMLTLYFVKGLFKFQGGHASYLEITEKQQPRLFAFIRRICADTGAPAPAKIFVSTEVNASVFYACTLWSLLWPPRKNLHIGLGLVNFLNLAEFKAVMAHEFGHFSQRSMRLGPYLYTANHIIEEIVYGRDWLDDSLSIFKPTLTAIRWLLGKLFHVINFAHAGMSRQMEFQADLVAVSVTGSDAIVHGLLRSDFAYDCLQTTWQDLIAAGDHRLYSDDIFYHQRKTAEYLRVVKDNPALGVAPEPGADEPVFPPDVTVLPPMWASHPPHYEREANCKRVYLRGARDDRSAWELFDNPDELRRLATEYQFALMCRGMPPPLQPAAEVQRFIADERAETVYSARYHGLYEGGTIAPGSIDELMAELPPRYVEPAQLRDEHAALFGPELRERLLAYRARCDDHQRLSRFANKVDVPRGGVFTFRDQEHRVADAARLVELLENEIKADHDYLSSLDRRIFLVYMAMARQLDHKTAQDLEYRYRFHLTVQEMVATLKHWQRQVQEALGLISGKRDPGQAAIEALVEILTEAENALDRQLGTAHQVQMPAFRNMKPGDPLLLFLDERPVIRGFIGSEQVQDGVWIKQSLQRHAEVIDKLRRMLFKSLGALLCLQERVGDEWKARFANEGVARPAAFRDSHGILAAPAAVAPGMTGRRRR